MALLGTLRSRRCERLWLALLCAAGLSPTLACADESAPLEAAVKAAYIYKFAPFVTWPDDKSDTFTICILRPDGVSGLLPQATAGQAINGRAIRIVVRPDDFASCRILYLAGEAAPEAVRGKPVLTISNGPGRGIIQLVTVEKHVRFDIDTRLAAESGLAISSKLLELARAVTARPPS